MTKQPITWIVVADGEHARIVVAKEKGASYTTLREFTSPAVHLSSHELGSDHPGRTNESATSGRHAIQPKSDPHERAQLDFAKALAAGLNEASAKHEFDRIVLVAQPRFATALREGLGTVVQGQIVGALQKDLTKVPNHQLAQHFEALDFL